jgi:hypothetical protein
VPSFKLAVAPDDGIHAVAVMAGFQERLAYPAVYVSDMDPATLAWSTPLRVDDAPNNSAWATLSTLAIDGAGERTAIWAQKDGLHAAHLHAGATAWTAPELAAQVADVVSPLSVTADAAGNLVVFGGATAIVAASRYSASTRTWSEPFGPPVTDGNLAQFADQPACAVSAGGDFLLLWRERVLVGPGFTSSRYELGTSQLQ